VISTPRDDRPMFGRSARVYDAVYAFKDYDAEAEHVRALITATSPGASTLLDVACGTGQHLDRLRHWFAVEGVDLDPGLLDVARERLGPSVALHLADMTSLGLGRSFDVVTCLFSSIGYVGTVDRLNDAVSAMAAHLDRAGLLIIEPWLAPDVWETGRPHLLTVDEPDLKVARMTFPERYGRLAVMSFDYLVATPRGVERFSERHETGLFTDREYRQAFEAAGLTVEHDAHGLIGRGLYIGRRVEGR
jgi:SAM-dependent methyltransferase